jgi:hypothetical protein
VNAALAASGRPIPNTPAEFIIAGRRIAYRLRDCEDWAAARTFRHRADELASTMTT